LINVENRKLDLCKDLIKTPPIWEDAEALSLQFLRSCDAWCDELSA